MGELDAIVARARGGDRDAFGEIVERTAGDVRAFIAAFCPSASVIDELAQVTYVRAYQNFAAYEHRGRLLSWLRGIARNVVREELRRLRRETTPGRETIASLVDRKQEERSGEPEAEHRVASLVECLKLVSGASRRLLEEFYVAGRTSDEIAQGFRRTAAWVRVTVLRVRRRLAECVRARLREKGVA